MSSSCTSIDCKVLAWKKAIGSQIVFLRYDPIRFFLFVVARMCRTPSAVLNRKSPYELIYKTDPNLSHLNCFGCLCYAIDLNPSNKFSSRSIKCVLVGFSTVKKVKHKDVLSVSSEKLFQTNDLSQSNFFDDIFEISVNTLSPNDEGRAAEHGNGSSDDNHEDDHCPTATHHEDNTFIPEGNTNSNDSFENINLRRSSRSTIFLRNLMILLLMEKSNMELKELLITVFRIKYKANEEIERYKARLVAKGYSKKEHIDYEETFSPIVKHVTVRCFITLAVQNNWPLYQLDINNAFLYGDLKEEIYMTIPEGYYTEAANTNKVCKLTKSLYGLKQSPRQWNEKLNAALVESGFVQSKSDYSLYVKNSDDFFIALLVYVDDIVITGNSEVEIKKNQSFSANKVYDKRFG
ncbi:uncharacterized protein [Rutidosis leptorrhynchoides]|uniref:uncharacterized protein n=1 Tax=Rutidosis leptorrhynchoides TaxID=125765 RepID=UPI003A99E008